MSISNITLSQGVRSNLLNLQNTADDKNLTQTRLSTGKKVNSALDNPSNFFTASSLTSRANDLSNLLDGMANGIQTIQAANNGLTSITTTLQSMQSTLNQARQDKSFQTQSYDIGTIDTSAVQKLHLSGGSVGTTGVDVDLNTVTGSGTSAHQASVTSTAAYAAPSSSKTFTISNGTTTKTVNLDATTGADIDTAISTITTALSGTGITVGKDAGGTHLTLTGAADGSNSITVAGTDKATFFGTALSDSGTPAVPASTGAVKTVDQLVADINGKTGLKGNVLASNDNGKLRIQNLSTTALTVGGANGTTGKIDGAAGSTSTVDGNSVRTSLAKQFDDLRDQLTKFGDDASFNGTNLLRGDNMKLTLNETGTSFIDVQSQDKDGNAVSIDNAFFQINNQKASDFDSDSNIDDQLDVISSALSSIRSVSSSLGSQLSSVQNRQTFTKSMINTLQTGSDNLTLADTNEEGANLLALNTRQQLETTSLSFASQADQAVLSFLR